MKKDGPRNFLPGPVEVFPDIREHLTGPIISHRSEEFAELYGEIVELLKKYFDLDHRFYIGTCSATGIMEAAIKNCVSTNCLCVVNGAFGERWYDIAVQSGKKADRLEVEWGKAVKPDRIKEALNEKQYEAVTVIHSESSTGVANPVDEIAGIVDEFEDTLLLVDAVSSAGGMSVGDGAGNIDIMVTGAQKAFAIPPGITPFAVSEKAFQYSREVNCDSLYFNFKRFEKYYNRRQPPTTPAIPHYYALHKQLKNMIDEGARQRNQRHLKNARKIRRWAKRHFELYSEEGYHSNTLTCVENTPELNISGFLDALKQRGYLISDGYGRLAGETFRIGHMGDWNPEDIDKLIEVLDSELESFLS